MLSRKKLKKTPQQQLAHCAHDQSHKLKTLLLPDRGDEELPFRFQAFTRKM